MESDLKTAPKEVLPQSDKEGPAPAEASTTIQMKSSVVAEEAPSKKNLYWIIGGVVLALALAAVGYFVVYPMIVNDGSDTPTTPPTTTTPPPTTTQPPVTTTQPHQSYFSIDPVRTSTLTLNPLSLPNIAFGLQSISLQPLANGSTEEIAVTDSQNNQIPFADYIAVFLPAADSSKLTASLENDFTAFIYYDDKGYWPGYIAKLKLTANVNELKAEVAKLEAADLTAFFITAPGAFSGFKDGTIGSYSTRYSVGSTAGAAVNYGFVDDYLLISTSYNGLQAAINLLGL